MPDNSIARESFRRLHESGCFAIPNPWDVGTARYLRHLGFAAVATTSAGFAFSQALSDSGVTRDRMLAHIAELVAAVDIPVNADFQSGFARTPEETAANALACAATGVAGLSIEDSTADAAAPLFDISLAAERIHAVRAALPRDVLLTARAECYLVHHPDPLRESIRRLQAYSEAGADVLYAPGPTSREDIEAIVKAVAPKPVNVLMSSHTGLSMTDLASLGVRRVSVGSAFARAAWTGFLHAARALAERGSFEGLEGLVPFGELDGFFNRR